MSRKTYEITATVRERVGKGSARALRREGRIPAVIYGDGKSPMPIGIDYKTTSERLHAGGFMTTVTTIDVGGDKILTLPKDYSLDPVRDRLVHVDFLRIGAGSTVRVFVPVHFVGQERSPGIKRGGALNVVRYEIEFECPADRIPEFIEVDVSKLEINDAVHVSEVVVPEGVERVIERDFTIATVAAPAGFKEAQAEAAATSAAAPAVP